MQQTIECYRRHTKDNETNKPIEQNLKHLKAESANMLKTVEDLEVSRRNVCAKTDYCKYDNQLLTFFKSSLYFAGLVSTFGASYVTRNKGRRASILVGAASKCVWYFRYPTFIDALRDLDDPLTMVPLFAMLTLNL
ncbi:hypothetical protein Gotur_022331 [Gossypium turneri]